MTAIDCAYIRAGVLRGDLLWSGDMDDSGGLNALDLAITREAALQH